jgi:hypothetical protein
MSETGQLSRDPDIEVHGHVVEHFCMSKGAVAGISNGAVSILLHIYRITLRCKFLV